MLLLKLRSIKLAKYRWYINESIRRYASQGCTSFSDGDLTIQMKHSIENHWRNKLNSRKFDPAKINKKYVVVPMFPYPSGSLHLGHVRVYTISDTMARFNRLLGKNVLHPIGWDAFGLPAENAAIERKILPAEWTKNNIEHMRKQLDKVGCSFDWDNELATYDPNYYKWTQWIFLQMFKDGMAYQREALVNWDPIDLTVLANEQVDENGCSWRSGAKVEKKLLKQWFIKSTKFAKQLYDGLDDPILEDWNEVKKMQQNWIGEPNGYSFDLELLYINPLHGNELKLKTITVWTKRPEKMSNPSFIAIKSNHILNDSGKNCHLLDVSAKNPFNDGTTIPIIVYDELEFNPQLDTYIGIAPENEYDKDIADKLWLQYDETLPQEKNRDSILKKAKNKNIGGYLQSARIRDWLISRQRYWGTPIPIVHCEKCGSVPVPESQLPIVLPDITIDESGKPIPLAKRTDWLNTICPKCKTENAIRESDTMDTFMDSSWYYLRYLNPKSTKYIFDKSFAKKFMPVDLYIGGIEHAVLHLYITRFVMQFLHKIGLINFTEPFKRLLVQGMVNGRTYVAKDGRYLQEYEVSILNEKQNKAEEISTGMPVQLQWEKMSKSKKNGVDPLELFAEYSIDTIRLIMLADVAPKTPRNWSKLTFPGIIKWQHRIWLCLNEFNETRTDESLLPPDENDSQFKLEESKIFESRNMNVCKITNNYENSSFGNVIKYLQLYLDDLRRVPANVAKYSPEYERALAEYFIMLSPIAPHFTSELWSKFTEVPNRLRSDEDVFQWSKDVLEQKFPCVDANYDYSLKIMINKKSTEIRFPRSEFESLTRDFAMKKATELDEYKKFIDTQIIQHVNFVDLGAVAILRIFGAPKEKKVKTKKAQSS